MFFSEEVKIVLFVNHLTEVREYLICTVRVRFDVLHLYASPREFVTLLDVYLYTLNSFTLFLVEPVCPF